MKNHNGLGVFRFIILLLFLVCVSYLAFNTKTIERTLQSSFERYFTWNICDEPIHYRVGSIDSRFGLSRFTAEQDVALAAQIWQKVSLGKPYFVFDDSKNATLTVNFIYDRRTSLDREINSLEGQVEQKDKSLQEKVNTYENDEAAFRQKLNTYNTQIEELNQQIREVNQKGGASQDEYSQLIQKQAALNAERSSLESEATRLNDVARSLNLSTQDYNTDVHQLNTTIDQFKSAVSQKPEEGLFDGKTDTISIYFADNYDELIHTLAHELGHAVGLEHNDNKSSIMYPFTTSDITPSINDISELTAQCSRRYLRLPFLGTINVIIGKLEADK